MFYCFGSSEFYQARNVEVKEGEIVIDIALSVWDKNPRYVERYARFNRSMTQQGLEYKYFYASGYRYSHKYLAIKYQGETTADAVKAFIEKALGIRIDSMHEGKAGELYNDTF